MKSHIKKIILVAAAAFTLCVGTMPLGVLADGTDSDADTGLSVSLSTSSGSFLSGDSVYTEVSLNNSPSISNLDLKVTYDSRVLSYVNTTWSTALGSDESASVHASGDTILLSIESDTGFSIGGNLATIEFKALSNDSSAPAAILIQSVTTSDEDEGELEEVDEDDDDTSSSKPDSKKPSSTSKSDGSSTSGSNGSSSSSKSGSSSSSSGSSGKTTTHISTTSSRKVDSSYKTGVFLGNNIFLVIGGAAGVCALVTGLLGRSKRK